MRLRFPAGVNLGLDFLGSGTGVSTALAGWNEGSRFELLAGLGLSVSQAKKSFLDNKPCQSIKWAGYE